MSREDDAVAYWRSAAETFMHQMGGRELSTHRAARALAWLEWAGYIVSPRLHEELCDAYAARLLQAEHAADELVARIHVDAGDA